MTWKLLKFNYDYKKIIQNFKDYYFIENIKYVLE
jgi:hypothetical protein